MSFLVLLLHARRVEIVCSLISIWPKRCVPNLTATVKKNAMREIWLTSNGKALL